MSRAFTLVVVVALSAGCFKPQNDLHGQCGSDADCGPGARCDKTQTPPICVASACNPPCDSSTTCDLPSVTCKPVSQPSVVITSPAANGFVGGRVQVAATARAPGSVQGVQFQVKNGAGAVIGTGSGSAASTGSADYAATLTLGASPDGPATVTAVLSYPGGTLTSDGVAVTLDRTPPVVTSLQVFLAGADAPTGQGVIVAYPDQPPGVTATNGFLSAHDKSQFSLIDQIHIKGTVTDSGAGLSCASLQYRIDGVDRNGAVVRAPTTQALPGCSADGTGTVNFDVPAVVINDLTKYGPLGAGTGNLQLVVLASDRTSGTANAMAENATPIKVTRLWWSREFSSIAPGRVSGLAIHPNEDVLVTYSPNPAVNVETLFALRPDGPFNPEGGNHWSVAAGQILGSPAIGTSSTPPVYVASNTDKKVYAFTADGPLAWSTGATAFNFLNSPAVVPAAPIVTAGCEAVIAGAAKVIFAACQDQPGSIAASTTATGLTNSISDSPTTSGGKNVFVGTDRSIAQTSFDVTTGLLTPAVVFTPPVNPIGTPGRFPGPLATSSSSVFAASVGDHKLYGVTFVPATETLPAHFTPIFDAVDILAPPSGMPVFLAGTLALFSTADAKLHKVSTTGVDGGSSALPTTGETPLLGHDGVIYIGRSSGVTAVDAAGAVAWTLTTPVNVSALTLACKGILYSAGGDTMYAVVTDMMSDPNNAGLADTPWPKFQRDSRNTGNADLPTRWGVRTAPGPGGCVQ